MELSDNEMGLKAADTLKEGDKKCPSCAGVMDFDPEKGALSCPFCGHVEAVEADLSAAELCITTADKLENCQWGAEKKTVVCQACGAESIYDALQIAAVCPFCDSNKVMEASCENTMAPGGVVPFSVSNTQAAELFKGWLKKKWFCPKSAKTSAAIAGFWGVYLPYWTFSADTRSDYKAEYGKDRREKRGDKYVTVTDWHKSAGSHAEAITDELIPATTNHNMSMLRGLEPFNTADNKAYKPEFLAGFAAERYAIGIKEAWQAAKRAIADKLNQNVESKIKREKRADHVRNLTLKTAYNNITYKYLLLPVWISHYSFHGKVYHFMVNGQTGKVSGNAPLSALRVAIAIILGIIALLILGWLGGCF